MTAYLFGGGMGSVGFGCALAAGSLLAGGGKMFTTDGGLLFFCGTASPYFDCFASFAIIAKLVIQNRK